MKKALLFSMVIILVGSLLPSALIAETRAEKQFFFAQGLFEEGKFDLSAQQFGEFIQEFPENKNCDRAQFGIGMSFWQLGEYAKAAGAFEKLLFDYPISELADKSLYQEGECYYQVKEYNKAISAYQRFIKEYSESEFLPYVLYSLGYIYFSRGEDENALRAFEKIKKEFSHFPYHSQASYNMAQIHYRNQKFEKAIEEFTFLIDNYPEFPYLNDAYQKRGFSYFQLKKFEEAEVDFRQINLHYWQGEALYQLEEYKEARAAYQTELKDPDSPWRAEASLGIAYTYYQEGNYSQSAGAFRNFINSFSTSPNLAEAQVRLGDSYYYQHDFHNAEDAYLNVPRVYPESEFMDDALLGTAYCYFDTGKFDWPLLILRKWLRIFLNQSLNRRLPLWWEKTCLTFQNTLRPFLIFRRPFLFTKILPKPNMK